MKVSYSMCGPRKDSDIICGPVWHFDWHSCSNLSTTSSLLLVSLSHTLIQQSVTHTKTFLLHARELTRPAQYSRLQQTSTTVPHLWGRPFCTFGISF